MLKERINARHPYFRKCDLASDTVLNRFQEYLVIQALTLHAMPEEWQECQRICLDELIPPYIYTLVNGDKIAGRGTYGKKKPTTISIKNESTQSPNPDTAENDPPKTKKPRLRIAKATDAI